MFFYATVTFALILLSGQIIGIIGQGEPCQTPNYKYGVCVVLPQCPSLVQLYGANQGNPQVINYLIGAQRNCGTRSIRRNPLVCCDRPLSSNVPQPNTQVPITQAPDGSEPWRQSVQPAPQTQPPPTQSPPTQSPPTQSPTTAKISRSEKLCYDPKGNKGTCRNIRECSHILSQFVARQNDPEYIEYIRESNGLCNYVQPNICCTEEEPVTAGPKTTPESVAIKGRLLTPDEGCGFSNTTLTRVVGGQPAKIGAWPWMALIGYTNNLNELNWKCGGTLITTRHVLTAAHCIKFTLSTVRLGEHDTSKENDSNVQDIKVVKVEKYPKYDAKIGNSDLAILYLERDADLSSRIVPICLPLAPERREANLENTSLFVAGWGRTTEGGKPSDILQQVQLPVLNNEVCKDRYRKQGKLIDDQKQFNDAVMCVGYLEGGKDSCQGDSGGPLMNPIIDKNNVIFFQAGIVSYGIGCARQDVPGVYTRVATFMDWITEKVAA